jgi:hypothetical protein
LTKPVQAGRCDVLVNTQAERVITDEESILFRGPIKIFREKYRCLMMGLEQTLVVAGTNRAKTATLLQIFKVP